MCDKGVAGTGIEKAARVLAHVPIRLARADEPGPKAFPGWPRQRVEAVTWTGKNQLGLERHAARGNEGGRWARTCRRICALNTVTWHTGSSTPRSSDHSSPTTTDRHTEPPSTLQAPRFTARCGGDGGGPGAEVDDLGTGAVARWGPGSWA
ncbi:hypothetical protein GCM10027294_12920 [Marinactinospora endophytica]